MYFGNYIFTLAKNLREYNKTRDDGKEAVFVGFRKDADGISRRFYIDRIIGTDTTIGEEYKIYFNTDDGVNFN